MPVASADPDSIHHVFLAYLDRSNYSIGAAGGLTDPLHITAAQAGLLGGLFFLGYSLFQVSAGGVVEAVALPAMLVFSSHWFTRAEGGRADTFLILGNPVTLIWISVVSGYLVAAVGYRWMFIIEGPPCTIRARPGGRRGRAR